MSHYIDLNSDLGESFGNYTLGMDSEVLNHVTSANVACGWHAGVQSPSNQDIPDGPLRLRPSLYTS